MTVPFLDLAAGHAQLGADIDLAIQRVVRSSHFVLGEEVEQFEREFSAYTEAAHCIGLGNGLDALHLALRAMGVGPDDEVIVPAHTFIATWLAVSHCGATPVPVEPSEDSYNMDPQRIEAALTERTKVIMPVHLYGLPADLDTILPLARRHGLRVLEDAAQCHGARYKGRRIGAHGDAVAWSFYPTKNLGAMGDGGAVTCADPALAERIRLLRNYGSREKYVNDIRGFNSRLDPMQAAILRAKLKHLDSWNEQRRLLAQRYAQELADSGFILPAATTDADHVWHLYVIRSPQRSRLANWLASQEIATQIHYPIPPHLQSAYADLGLARGSFGIAERLADELISLPMWPQMEHAMQDRVIAALRKFPQ
ncbi:MAG TPA: DegT/DnrJ/EryC1/StrS family aminotransferase [Sideroxyarcus sp.]|nr:DegT/DnrJ/EryC1/StrS family aminotransferase [Sideroxyarcus sp.]